jgi:large repetitive protein
MSQSHIRKVRRLKILSRHLERMMENGSFYALPFWRRYAMVRRVKRLYASLLGPLSPAAVRAVMAGAAALALAACPSPSGSPRADNPAFAAAQMNPFGLQQVAAPAAPAFADINGDGDADFFAGAGGEGEGIIRYFANTGSTTSPSFAAPADYPFLPNTGSPSVAGPVPVFAPIDNPPYFDLLLGHRSSSGPTSYLEFYPNIAGEFDPSQNAPTDLPTTGSWYDSITPSGADLNGDGLIDVVLSTTDNTPANTIQYFQNTGTASAPVFTDQLTDLDLVLPAGNYAYPTFVDIDADGDFDAFVGNELGDLYFFRNTGTATAPAFAAPVEEPFGLTGVTAGPAIPAFMDIDADGDFDLFVGDANGDFWYFENTNL